MTDRTEDGTAYEITGPDEAPWVILIHGLGLTRRTWDGMLPQIEQQYRVLNYDLAGHGESAPSKGTLSLTVFANQLLSLMDTLVIPHAALIGFSLGGMINRRFAIDHPDRVTALAILNSPHERGDAAQQQVEQSAADASDEGPGAVLDAAIERWFTAEFRDSRPDVIGQVRTRLLANDPDSYAATRRVLAHGVVELIRPEPPIEISTLVVTCENDSGSTPAMSQAIANEIPGAAVTVLPDLKHMGLVERPELFNATLLGFLKSLNLDRLACKQPKPSGQMKVNLT